jgi:AcrR family transcriptional regulator
MAKPLTEDEIEEFRDLLCDAATRLFAEEGYSGVTLRRLAEEAHCSRQTPYRFFRNKDAIFADVYLRSHKIFTDYCERAAEAMDDPKAVLLRIRDAYLAFAQDEPHAYKVVFGMEAPLQFPPVQKQLDYARSQLEFLFTWAVREGVVEGDPEALAYLYWSALEGLVRLHQSTPAASGLKIDEVSRSLERMFFGPAADTTDAR